MKKFSSLQTIFEKEDEYILKTGYQQPLLTPYLNFLNQGSSKKM